MNKPLPNNLQAELELLEGILYDNEKMVTALSIVNPEDFYNSYCKNVFLIMNKLYAKDKHISTVTICNEIGEKNLNKVGGLTFIMDLTKGGFRSINVKDCAEIVKDLSSRRMLIKTCESTILKAYENKYDYKDLVSKVQNIQVCDNKQTIKSYGEVLDMTSDFLEELSNSNEIISGLKTGYSNLDNAINGLKRGNLTILAGRPSIGKTTFAFNIMDNLGSNGYKGLFFELEMDLLEVGMKSYSSNCMLSSYAINRSSELSDKDWINISEVANQKFKENNLFFEFSSGLSLMEIREKSKSLKISEGLDFIVIDYLTLMKIPEKEKHYLAVGDITKGLKKLAKDLNISVILLSQLNRNVEARTDKRPMLGDLRDSGNIEEDADLVMLLYRDDYYNEDTEEKGILEVNIAKHRHGGTGILYFNYLKEFNKIVELEQ